MEPRYNETADLLVDLPVIYGGFWERFGAAIIDAIIISIPNYLFQKFTPAGVSGILSIALSWLYYAIQESSPAQATVGKKALGLRVTDLAGGQISFGQATGRYFGKIISTIILLIGYFMMLWNPKRQTLHDQMAGTLVVKS